MTSNELNLLYTMILFLISIKWFIAMLESEAKEKQEQEKE